MPEAIRHRSLVVAPAALAMSAPSAAFAAGGEGSILAGDIGNVFWTLLIFLIVVGILAKYAWGPVLKVLKDREVAIRDSLENAKREREEADKLLARYREQIDKAREEATAIVEEGRRDGEEVRRRIHDEARRESDEMIARARREIQLATDTAVKELYDQTAALAVDVASRIIRKELSAHDHQALVRESLDRMKSAG